MTYFSERFGDQPDGAATTGWNYPTWGPRKPWVRDGFLTVKDPVNFQAGSYHVVECGRDVVRIGCRFALTPSSVGGGLLCLSIQEENIAATYPSVPRSPMHLYLEAGYWHVDVNDASGTPVDPLVHQAFRQPLVADGKTLYDIDIHLNRDAGSAYVILPDGSSATLLHPLFSLPGRFAYVEPFKVPDPMPVNQSDALIKKWWLDY